MKFVCKLTNHRVSLIPAQPGEPLTGRLPQPGLSVRFENGQANVVNEKAIELMMNHKNFGRDFVAVEEGSTKDPWKRVRGETEPNHLHTEIKYGHIGAGTPGPAVAVPRQKQIALEDMIERKAQERAIEILAEAKAQAIAKQQMAEAPVASTPPTTVDETPVVETPVVETTEEVPAVEAPVADEAPKPLAEKKASPEKKSPVKKK